jgi:uncharacterized membrane protein YqiK
MGEKMDSQSIVVMWLGAAVVMLSIVVAWLSIWLSKLCGVIRRLLRWVLVVMDTDATPDEKGIAYDMLENVIQHNRAWL